MTESKSVVLPLHHRTISFFGSAKVKIYLIVQQNYSHFKKIYETNVIYKPKKLSKFHLKKFYDIHKDCNFEFANFISQRFHEMNPKDSNVYSNKFSPNGSTLKGSHVIKLSKVCHN